ncbi:MAG: response regulator [Halobacteriovoraceae bacterium]|jgi:two-component system, OmpR family, response regulator VanR|nr:response regulator [Halobacteriovoraceae bacterium]
MKNKKILVVDDESDLRQISVEILTDITDNIFEAEDGLDALKVYEKNKPFDCIICDINMPKMNGIEFIKAIREKNDETPFIFFTAFGNRKLMLEAVTYGAFDFIDKPKYTNLIDVAKSALNLNPKEEKLSEEELLTEYQTLLAGKSD